MNDRYTKKVLTIIAACLVVQTLLRIGFISDAMAGAMSGSWVAHDVVKVSICNPGGDLCGDSWIQYVRQR